MLAQLFSYPIVITLCKLGNFTCFCCCLLTFFKINFFKKFFLEHYQIVKQFWIQIRTDILSVLIWVQAVCKDYQQITSIAASKERVNICFGCSKEPAFKHGIVMIFFPYYKGTVVILCVSIFTGCKSNRCSRAFTFRVIKCCKDFNSY